MKALLGLAVACLTVSLCASPLLAQTTCGQGKVFPRSGNFLFKPQAAHFNTKSVVIAPKNNFDPITNTNNISSVTMHRVDTGQQVSRASLKSTGYCPGWGECLNAPTYTFPITGYVAKRRFPAGVFVRIRYKKSILGTLNEAPTKVKCEEFVIENSRCRTPCDITSIRRKGEYHHPSCSLKWPACITTITKAGYE